jgi:hypothetical protein
MYSVHVGSDLLRILSWCAEWYNWDAIIKSGTCNTLLLAFSVATLYIFEML